MGPVETIEAFLAQPALKRMPRRLLVALSGGADSVALLRASVLAGPKSGWRVEALHCDHGLRGRDSRADAAFVKALCERLKVPLKAFSADLKAGAGLEERARNWRRACYRRAARDCGAALVLLGHHVRDQAETVLLNLVRGSGAAGAAGMTMLAPLDSAAGPRLGRPFLGLEPAQLKRWLRSLRQPWREDASNRDVDFARNRIRLRVLPELETLNPKAAAHLAEFAAKLAPSKRGREKDLAGLLRLDQGARQRAAKALARGKGSADLGQGWSLELSSGRARVLAPDAALDLAVGSSVWGDWRFELKLAVPSARKLSETGAFWFAPGLLKAGARLRSLKAGERLKPFGFGGRRKAADLLREAGVPAWDRESWPALEAEGRLLALPAARRGTGFEAEAGRKALRLTWKYSGVDKTSLK
ncbi:MAG TPA: tRNA lysidine(34) synthetase TilS [bacterium]|nr:tRNA lysidine(34) synthetase TilS [bacterium]